MFKEKMINDKPNGLNLMLPWPDSILNPNRKDHWAKKHRPKVAAREAGYYIALDRGVKLDAGKKYVVELVFCPPDKRKRDLDNLVSSMKSALDGMCRGLGIDDEMIRPLPDWGPVVKGGKVEVTITEKIDA